MNIKPISIEEARSLATLLLPSIYDYFSNTYADSENSTNKKQPE